MHIDNETVEELKVKLLEEKASLEKQLGGISVKDKHNKDNYTAKFQDLGDDEEQNAEEVVEYELRLGLERKYEVQLQLVNKALKKIEEGSYGICEKTGDEISVDRLRALPWAECATDENK